MILESNIHVLVLHLLPFYTVAHTARTQSSGQFTWMKSEATRSIIIPPGFLGGEIQCAVKTFLVLNAEINLFLNQQPNHHTVMLPHAPKSFPLFFFFVGDVKWEEGKVSGTVYCGGKELTELLTKVI